MRKGFLWILLFSFLFSLTFVSSASILNVETLNASAGNLRYFPATLGVTYSNWNLSYSLQYPFETSCYQETANVSASCGGLDNGSYYADEYWKTSGTQASKYAYDGNWNTMAYPNGSATLSFFSINYSKPSPFTSAIVQMRVTSGSTQNVTLPASCMAQSQVQLVEISNTTTGNMSCYNGSELLLLANGEPSMGNALYEEAVIWIVDNSSARSSFNLSIAGQQYYFNDTILPNETAQVEDFSSVINSLIADYSCSCSGCILNSSLNICNIPLLFSYSSPNMTYNSSFDLISISGGLAPAPAGQHYELKCITKSRIQVCSWEYVLVANTQMPTLSQLKDQFLAGASFKTLLVAWNPSVAPKLTEKVKIMFTDSNFNNVLSNTYDVVVLLIKYVLREPASLMATPLPPQ